MAPPPPLSEAERVWDFWFGGAVADNFRAKWFPTSSLEAQAAADAAVEAQFGDLLEAALRGELDGWRSTPHTCVCLIVVLDQFSRHINRLRREPPGSAPQAAADAAALSAAEALLAAGWEARLSVPEHIFALMPLRHTAALPQLERAMAQAEARAGVEATHGALLARFRRATLRRLQDAQGKQWRAGDELLEHAAFDADESRLLREPLSQTVAAFMARHAPAAAASPRPPPSAPPPPPDTLPVAACVSLSGGVDSMVLAHILSRLGAGRWRVAGVHIDYGNRPESGAEAAFVEAWCAQHGIVYRLKRITEVKRGIAGRDEYERESRRLRYDFYAACLAEFGACGGVCVGHHAGDVQENVITNLLKGTSLLAISGMSEVSRVNGVPVWRPLLSWDKDVIFAFAHKYGVPYFRDTTPTWSTRGKLRRQVLPILHEVFGEGVMRNLSTISADAEQLSAMVHGALLRPFWDAAHTSDVGVWFDAAPWLGQPMLFWKEGLKALCHGMGAGLVKEKAVGEMLIRLERSRGRDGWLPLKRENRAYICGTRLAIFATQVFPPAPHFASGTPLALGAAATFGPWTVRCDAVDALDADGHSLLTAPPLSMWDVLTGDFCYHLPLLPVDEAASAVAAATLIADADVAAAGGAVPSASLGLRVAVAPIMPPVRGMPHDLRAALPLVVSGCDGDEPERDSDGSAATAGSDTLDGCAEEEDAVHAAGGSGVPTGAVGGGGAAPRIYVVRAWSAAALAALRCVRVHITYTRPKRTATESDAATAAPE